MRMLHPAPLLAARSEPSGRGRAMAWFTAAVSLLLGLSACAPGPLQSSATTSAAHSAGPAATAPTAARAASEAADGRKRIPTPVPRGASAAQ
jgi:hypothetical protein